MLTISNGLPYHNPLGVHDLSGRRVPFEFTGRPQHLPLIFLRTKTGKNGFQHLTPSNAVGEYGIETFRPNGEFNYVDNNIARICMSEGNEVCVVRTNDNPALRAGLKLYAIAEDETVTITKDKKGNTLDASVDITRTKVTYIAAPFDSGTGATTSAGSNVFPANLDVNFVETSNFLDTLTNEQKAYEILTIQSSSSSLDMLGIGISIESFVGTSKNAATLKDDVLTFGLRIHETIAGNVIVKQTVMGDPYVETVLKEDYISPTSKAPMDISAILPEKWFNDSDDKNAFEPRILTDAFVNYEEINELLERLRATEATAISAIVAANPSLVSANLPPKSKYSFDPFGFKDSDGYKLYGSTRGSLTFNNVTTVTLGTPNMVVFLNNDIVVNDGIQEWLNIEAAGNSDAAHEAFIRTYMAEYNDINGFKIDMAPNPETVLYDARYSLETKESLVNFIAKRKNTFVSFTTSLPEDALRDVEVPIGEHIDRLNYLMAIIRLMPDSEYYNTNTIRANVVVGDGKLKNSVDKNYYPLLFSNVQKSAAYFGASNGKMVKGKLFDSGDGAVIDIMKNVRPNKLNLSAKTALWEGGAVYPQYKDRGTFYIPAQQTVYTDVTSIDNHIFSAFGIMTLTWYNDIAHSQYSGDVKRTDAVLARDVKETILNLARGSFDGLFEIEVDVVITERDAIKGNSWHVIVKMYGGVMKTEMTSTIETHRRREV